MANEINHFIDTDAVGREKDFMINSLKEIIALMDKISSTEITLKGATSIKDITDANNKLSDSHKKVETIVQQRNIAETNLSSSYTQNIKNLNDYKKALADNQVYQKEAVKDVESGRIGADEYRQKITDLTAAALKYRSEITRLNSELKTQTQLQRAVPTSIFEAKLQNKQLTTQRDLLPTTDTKGIAELNALIDRNNKLIDENSDKLAKQKINIGNYGPSVKTALSLVEEELQKINAQLAQTEQGTAQFDLLTKKADLLKSVSQGLDKPFASTRSELRALEETAQAVGQEFGIDSEQFRKFSDTIGSRKDEINDIRKALDFKASDTKGLDATVGAIQAVVGAYGAYQAAAVLTGEDNEELQKSMVKLQAALTLVTSVQAVANQLQTESATVQGALALKTTLLAAAQKLVGIAAGTSTTALAAETTAAESADVALTGLAATQAAAATTGEGIAVSSAESAAAMETEAVAAGSLGVSLDTVVVGEAAVATGATTMTTALVATGIGLLLVGLAIAVYKIVQSVKDWNAANDSLKKSNEELAKSMKSLADAAKVYDDINRAATNRQIQDMEKRIAKQKALGVSSAQSLALDKQLSDARIKATQDELKLDDITLDSIKKKEAAAINAAGNVKAAEELKNKYIESVADSHKGDKNYKKTIERWDAVIQKQKDDADLANTLYQNDFTKFQANETAKQDQANISNNIIKLSAEDRRKFILETSKIEADIQIANNERILNNERSTLNERVGALRSNLEEQKKILQAENAAVQNDPTVSRTDKTLSTKKTLADIEKAEQESQDRIRAIKEEYRLRDIQATSSVQKSLLNIVIASNQEIINNDALTEEERLNSLRKNLDARKQLLETDLRSSLSSAGISDADIQRIEQEGYFEIQNKKITNEELKKLVSDYNLALVQITRDSTAERLTITKDYYQKEQEEQQKAIRAIQQENDQNVLDLTDTYTNNIVQLNESYKAGLISTQQYNRSRLDLENQFQQDSLRVQLDTIQKQLEQARKGVEVEESLQEELNQLKAVNVSKLTNEEKSLHDKRLKIVSDELKSVQDAVGKETELYKKLNDVIKQLSDAEKKGSDDTKNKFTEDLQEMKSELDRVTGIFSSALNAQSIRKKNDLQDQSDAIDANTKKEIDAINATAQSEQDKAAAIQIVNAKAQVQKDQINQKNRQIDEENAKAQKKFAIFEILLNTAIAISKAIPDPFKVAFASVTGAAELAIAVATPVPKYRLGKKDSYEGMAIVDDGGQVEPIYRAKTKTIELGGTKDRLTYLGRNDIVFPSVNALLSHEKVPTFESITVTSNKTDFKPVIEAIESISITTQIVTERGHEYRNQKLKKYNDWVNRNIYG